MKISVVTTVYNRPDHLRLLLAALAAQTRVPDELIVADDGSDAATAAAASRERQPGSRTIGNASAATAKTACGPREAKASR